MIETANESFKCSFILSYLILSYLILWYSHYTDYVRKKSGGRQPFVSLLPLGQSSYTTALIARFMGPTWGPFGAGRTQVGPMLAPWTLLSGWDCQCTCPLCCLQCILEHFCTILILNVLQDRLAWKWTKCWVNDDVIKWRHFPGYWPFVQGIHRSPVNSPHKGQWRGALMFYLVCAWINGWVNNGEAGDLRRHRAHYDVIVMFGQLFYLVKLNWYHSDVILGTMASQIISVSIAKPFVHAQFKQNNKALRHWSLWVEFTVDRWIPRTKGQ